MGDVMNNISFSLLLTVLAGFSTLIGYFIVYIKKDNYNKIIVGALSFASGVMICTSISDLIPESINLLSDNFQMVGTISLCFLGLLFGTVISMIIDYYVPDSFSDNNKSLYRVGLLSMIVIVMHNIPEGIATFMVSSNDVHLGISLALAIAMHNIPEGISISIPIYYSTGKKSKAFLYTLVSAISEPLGAIIALVFLKNIINNVMLGIILASIAGIMLEIAFRTLLPSSKKYGNNKEILFYFIIGIIFMLIKFLL